MLRSEDRRVSTHSTALASQEKWEWEAYSPLTSHPKGVLVHYRETILWQKAMEAAKEGYRLAPSLPREETYGMRSQFTRALVSVPANIAEGWTRESDREKAQFLAIAHGSVAEAETLLTLCEQIGWFPEVETATLRALLGEVSRILTTLRKKFRAQERAA